MAPRWRLFAGATLIVLFVVLGLSRATARELTGPDGPASRLKAGADGESSGEDRGVTAAESEFTFAGSDAARAGGESGIEGVESKVESAESAGDDGERALADRPYAREGGATGETGGSDHPGDRRDRAVRAGDPNLLLSAALSQALVGGLLAGLAWYAEVPAGALGIDDPAGAVLPGVTLGVGLYAANEAGAWLAERTGFDADESLRALLAPDTRGEWVLLLLVVLPVVAGVEELLFRGALIGALAAGFPVSPWLLAVLSSVAFGVGHGLQGPGGILVTGVLGFALAAAFVLTGSLWLVIVAHYLVNALEFLVHEWIGVEWSRS